MNRFKAPVALAIAAILPVLACSSVTDAQGALCCTEFKPGAAVTVDIGGSAQVAVQAVADFSEIAAAAVTPPHDGVPEHGREPRCAAGGSRCGGGEAARHRADERVLCARRDGDWYRQGPGERCDAIVSAKAECTPLQITVTFSGAADVQAAGKLKAAFEANLGVILAFKARLEGMATLAGTITARVMRSSTSRSRASRRPTTSPRRSRSRRTSPPQHSDEQLN